MFDCYAPFVCMSKHILRAAEKKSIIYFKKDMLFLHYLIHKLYSIISLLSLVLLLIISFFIMPVDMQTTHTFTQKHIHIHMYIYVVEIYMYVDKYTDRYRCWMTNLTVPLIRFYRP